MNEYGVRLGKCVLESKIEVVREIGQLIINKNVILNGVSEDVVESLLSMCSNRVNSIPYYEQTEEI